MIYFRVDSNEIIASGHIMRCLSIAEELVKIGVKICFLVSDENSSLILEDAKVEYIILHSDWRCLDFEIDTVKRILEKDYDSVLLVDTYSITRKYVEILSNYAKVCYLGSKKEYLGNLSLLINYSTNIDYAFYKSCYVGKTKLLLGPSYAPLRKEFQNVTVEHRENVCRILITTGNTDHDDIVSAIIDECYDCIKTKKIVCDVVIGGMFKYKEKLIKRYGNLKFIQLHTEVRSMSNLMKICDLAISANGTTVYELSAMAVPTITFAISKEQIQSAESLYNMGVVDYCGPSYLYKEQCVYKIAQKIDYYIAHKKERLQMANKAKTLISGNGCEKIAEALALL